MLISRFALELPGTGLDGDATTVQSETHDLSQSSLVGRSCADAKMMTTSSFTASTLTLTSTPPSECFGIDDEILIWNQGNGVHYFRTVASLTSNVITIKGGEIDVEKLGSSDSLLVQRVPNYNTLTVVSGSILTHAAYGTYEYGGVLAFRVFTSLVVQEGGVIDMHEKGYRGGISGSAAGFEYFAGRKAEGGGTGGKGGGAHACGSNNPGHDGTNGAGGGGGGGGGSPVNNAGGSCTHPCRGGGGGSGGGNSNSFGGYVVWCSSFRHWCLSALLSLTVYSYHKTFTRKSMLEYKLDSDENFEHRYGGSGYEDGARGAWCSLGVRARSARI